MEKEGKVMVNLQSGVCLTESEISALGCAVQSTYALSVTGSR